MVVTPYIVQRSRYFASGGWLATQHLGYAFSKWRRKKIEEPFGWAKTMSSMAQTTLPGIERIYDCRTGSSRRCGSGSSDTVMTTYHFICRLKTLGSIAPYGYIYKTRTSKPDQFLLNPIHQCHD